MIFRDGQWVSWTGEVPGAHRARNGKTVGVYHRARKDTFGVTIPARCVPVSKDVGGPLPSGEGLANLQFFPEQCLDLEPIVDRADIPAERIKGNPEWQPRR